MQDTQHFTFTAFAQEIRILVFLNFLFCQANAFRMEPIVAALTRKHEALTRKSKEEQGKEKIKHNENMGLNRTKNMRHKDISFFFKYFMLLMMPTFRYQVLDTHTTLCFDQSPPLPRRFLPQCLHLHFPARSVSGGSPPRPRLRDLTLPTRLDSPPSPHADCWQLDAPCGF